MTVNERLKIYLKDHGIKQQFLAEKLGVTKSVISNMLNNKREITACELNVISKILNVNLDFFYHDC